MNLLYSGILAVAGLPLGPPMAHADDTEIVYYDVVGNSAEELRHQMDTKGPFGEGGRRVDGHTDWKVTWSYQYAPAADGCRFTELGITVSATMTLPRWAPGDDASNALLKKWQAYIASLRVHEDGHYSHGVKAADAIKSLGQSFHTSDGCSIFAKNFNDEAASIIEKYRVADASYDADTQHGRTQGAIFP
jgi:predicted secreted Zn-dependent protease